jgi:uncharacterized protein with PIN domain/sulfur carrier protein ThiS
MDRAYFHFHGSLNDFLPRRQRQTVIERQFDWRASIKDMIESLGVPHAEISLIVVNGRSVGFDHIVQAGDKIDIYPCTEVVDVPARVYLRPPLPDEPGFVLDVHLGRLASYLRMMGFDTLYNNNSLDQDLALIAYREERILLTRDVGLLKRSIVIHGYYVRSTVPRQQIVEVLGRFDLMDKVKLFMRCLKCNGLLQRVEKAAIMHQILPETARYHDEFCQCQTCGQVYWKGSHYERMQRLIKEVLGKEQS